MPPLDTEAAVGAAGAEGEQPMVEGRGVAGVILRLALPTVAVLILHSALLAEEAALLGQLSATKLAGAALCFPWLMLMAMMSSGGLGGGVSSAIARAVGAGRQAEVYGLMGQALVIAVVMGGTLSIGLGLFYEALFDWLGSTGEVAEAAGIYGGITFAGGTFMWTSNILSSVFRGLGNTMLPAKYGAMVTIVIAIIIPPVVMGWGPIPAGGLTGAAVVMVIYYFANTLALGWRLVRHVTGSRTKPWHFAWHEMKDILHVGIPSSFNTLLSAGLMVLATSIAARLGKNALAAFGAASRIEGLLMPFVFGIGSALVPLVGMNVGAGNWAQVRRLAWTGAGLGTAVAGTVGLTMWLFPGMTMKLFTDEAGAIDAGVTYLKHSAWAYGFWGLGVGMTFSCQGARRPITSLGASAARFLYVGAGGLYLLRNPGYGTGALGLLMGSSALVFGLVAVLLAGPLLPEWRKE